MPTERQLYRMYAGGGEDFDFPQYQPRRSSLLDLTMLQGQQRADAYRQSGDFWANTIANIGQGIGSYYQQRDEAKRKKTRDDAYLAIMQDPKSLEDPRYAHQQFLKAGGPEDGLRMFQAFAGGIQLMQPNRDPQKDQQAAAHAIDGLRRIKDPEKRAQVWSVLSPPAGKVFGGQLPQQYDDKFFNEVLVPFAESQLPKTPRSTKVVEGALVDDQTGETLYTAPAKPPTPAYQSKDVLLDGKPAMVNFDSHSGRYSVGDQDVTSRVRPIPPQGPQPKQPEWKDAEDAEGNPVLVDYATGQTKPYPGGAMPKPGAAEANRIAAADAALSSSAEVKSYLSKPEVRKAIGPLMGRFNSLAQAAGAGDPVAVELVGMLKSYSALQPQIHGFRNVHFAQDIEKLLSTHQTPETLEAALRGIDSAAENVRNRRRTPKEPGGNGGIPIGTRRIVHGRPAKWDGRGWVAE